MVKTNKTGNDQAKTRQKVLLPTLKEQQRYVVYKVMTQDNITNFGQLHEGIINECNGLLGVFDGAKAGLMGAKYDVQRRTGMIRVERGYVEKLKLCLGLIKGIRQDDRLIRLTVDCKYVSGMLAKAEQRMKNEV